MSLGLLLTGCSEVAEEALQADTAEESASDLITYFEKADPKLQQLAKEVLVRAHGLDYCVKNQHVSQPLPQEGSNPDAARQPGRLCPCCGRTTPVCWG